MVSVCAVCFSYIRYSIIITIQIKEIWNSVPISIQSS